MRSSVQCRERHDDANTWCNERSNREARFLGRAAGPLRSRDRRTAAAAFACTATASSRRNATRESAACAAPHRARAWRSPTSPARQLGCPALGWTQASRHRHLCAPRHAGCECHARDRGVGRDGSSRRKRRSRVRTRWGMALLRPSRSLRRDRPRAASIGGRDVGLRGRHRKRARNSAAPALRNLPASRGRDESVSETCGTTLIGYIDSDSKGS